MHSGWTCGFAPSAKIAFSFVQPRTGMHGNPSSVRSKIRSEGLSTYSNGSLSGVTRGSISNTEQDDANQNRRERQRLALQVRLMEEPGPKDEGDDDRETAE